jgi:hypothetical protein
MRGRGSLSFEMENFRVEHLQYIFDLASGSISSLAHEPEYLADRPGKTTRLLLENAILPQQSPKDIVTFRIMDVECLIPAFGASWFYQPMTEHNHITGDFMASTYACIPHINSNINIGLDINSMVMRCTVPVVAVYDQKSTLEGISVFKSKLADWRDQLLGRDFHDPDDNLYYHVVEIEHNMHNFVDRKRRSLAYSCVVAWLACYNDYEIYEEPQIVNQSKRLREVRERFCHPFIPEDVAQFAPVDMSALPASSINVDRPSKKHRALLEMPDASGLDLETYVWKQKDRSRLKPSAELNFDHEAIAAKFLSIMTLEIILQNYGISAYALNEVWREAHCTTKDFYVQLVVALDSPAYNVDDLARLFLEVPVFQCFTAEEDITKLQSFKTRQKRALIEFAVKKWCTCFAADFVNDAY